MIKTIKLFVCFSLVFSLVLGLSLTTNAASRIQYIAKGKSATLVWKAYSLTSQQKKDGWQINGYSYSYECGFYIRGCNHLDYVRYVNSNKATIKYDDFTRHYLDRITKYDYLDSNIRINLVVDVNLYNKKTKAKTYKPMGIIELATVEKYLVQNGSYQIK